MPPREILPSPPEARQDPVRLSMHGQDRDDPYYWLRDENWQEVMRDPSVLRVDIRAHLDEENAYASAVLSPTEDLQARIYQEIRGRIKEDEADVPSPDGPYAYWGRFETGGQYPVYCRGPRETQDADSADGEVLLHGDTLAEGEAYFDFGDIDHSADHRYLAYASDTQGSELFTIQVKDLTSGAMLPDRIEGTDGSFVWTADSQALVYVRRDAHLRPSSVWLHRLGHAPEEDVLLYREEDPTFYVGVGLSESRRFILVSMGDHETTETRVFDAFAPQAPGQVIAPRRPGHQYAVSHHNDHFIIQTNAGDAEDFRIVRAPVATPQEAHWDEIVPHERGRLLLDMVIFENHLVRRERRDGLPRIHVDRLGEDSRPQDGHQIAFEEEAYALDLDPGHEFASTMVRFVYASPTTPSMIFDYDMVSRERTLRRTQTVPSGHDPDDYVTRRLQVTAPDGALVPVTLLYRSDLEHLGEAPVLLYGYGSYGISIPAGFSVSRLSLVDRGFIYAIAHIRGGKDRGYHWYRDGKLDRKMNTFTDFIAVAEGLIGHGFGKRDRIIAQGGSAGGLLMGAVANLRPDLFQAIIAEVPFVDVLTTICDDSLPLTPPEWTEWGNPITDPQAYETILEYSPYDQIQSAAYPHVLATAGLSDPRVTYWEPAKWVARLRERRTDEGLTLLWTYMEAGHAGAAGRFDQIKETAMVFAFACAIADGTLGTAS